MPSPVALSRLILVGSLLSVIGGFLNGVAVSCLGLSLTTLTGNTTGFAVELGKGDFREVLKYGNVIAAFAAGSFLSGLIIKNEAFRMKRHYFIVILVEGLLLSIAGVVFHACPAHIAVTFVTEFLISASAAVQNSAFSTLSSAVVRSTHVTGMIADLACFLGHRVAFRDKHGLWRIKVFGCLIFSFFVGSLVGGVCGRLYGLATLLVIGPLLSVSGFLGFLARARYRRMVNRTKGRKRRETMNSLADPFLDQHVEADSRSI